MDCPYNISAHERRQYISKIKFWYHAIVAPRCRAELQRNNLQITSLFTKIKIYHRYILMSMTGNACDYILGA
jgi:hypothetical protein